MKHRNVAFITSVLFLIILVSFAVGCGGGTRGTGGQLFEGSVIDKSGKGIEGVDVTILANGDTARTGARGLFQIATESVSGDVEFLLEGSNFSGRGVASNVPADAARVIVQFSVGGGTQPQIETETQVVERHPAPTPEDHRPTQRPTRLPTTPPGVASATPTAPPLATPMPTATSGRGGHGSDDGGSDGSGSDDNTGGSDGGGNSGNDGSHGGGSGDDGSNGGGPTPTPSPTRTARPGDGVKAEGLITSLSPTLVTVETSSFVPVASTEYRGKNGSKASLSDFQVGDSVKAEGISNGTTVELRKLEKR